MPESIYSKFKSIRRDGSIVVPRDLFLSEFNQAVKDGRLDEYDDDEEYLDFLRTDFIDVLCAIWLVLTTTKFNDYEAKLYWDTKFESIGMPTGLLASKFSYFFTFDAFLDIYERLGGRYKFRSCKSNSYFGIIPPEEECKLTVYSEGEERFTRIGNIFAVLCSKMVNDAPDWMEYNHEMDEKPWWVKLNEYYESNR